MANDFISLGYLVGDDLEVDLLHSVHFLKEVLQNHHRYTDGPQEQKQQVQFLEVKTHELRG